MEKVVWENRALEEKLKAALMEQADLEDVLDEMDQEHDEAFARIRFLEAQVRMQGPNRIESSIGGDAEQRIN